jgi:hypothetical protein
LRPHIAWKLIAGSGIFAVTQFFPILQIIAGALALELAATVGLPIFENASGVQEITSPLAGFVVTLLVGCMLMALAAAIELFWAFIERRRLAPIER